MTMSACHATFRCLRHLLVALAILCGCGRSAGGAPPKAPAAQAPTTASAPGMHWSGKIPAGRVLDIREVAGKVHVMPATGDVGDVDASVEGATDGKAPIRIVEDERGVSIRSEEHGDHDEPCSRDHDGHDERQVAIDIVAHVPAGVRLIVRTVEGSIDVDRVQNAFEVHAVNGAIDLRSVSGGNAHTVNGTIHASFAGAGPSDDSELATVNGSVDVTLSAAASTEVAARSLNGAVSVDFPVTGSLERHEARGSIGHGGHSLRLRSVNGAIHVARGTT